MSSSSSSSKMSPASHGDWSQAKGVLPGRKVMGPLFLMLTTPVFSIVYYHVCAHMRGDFALFARVVMEHGLWTVLNDIWPSPFRPKALQLIATFMGLQLVLQKYMPGATFRATMTPKGHVPVYKANGLASYLTTLAILLVSAWLGLFSPAVVYDEFGHILSSLNVFAWILCWYLVYQGHVAPTTQDSGTNGSLVQDFFWGMDLYPNILGWDVKMFTNCRCGMMFWAVGILCFAHKNMELHNGNLQYGMAVNVILQLIYITKFFYWEMGYMCSMDIQHDRAGYYLCWGCLVWVPAVYTSHSFYLVQHGPDLTFSTALAILIAGFLCVYINYDSDNQRYVFRQTHGNCLIWGQTPKYLVAKYQVTNGSKVETKQSLLLLSGWWSVSRHFHYIPEILASLCWSLPALDTGLVGPYFYVIYLTILLTDRSFRDDARCRAKYGDSWDEYCSAVPYKIVPGVL